MPKTNKQRQQQQQHLPLFSQAVPGPAGGLLFRAVVLFCRSTLTWLALHFQSLVAERFEPLGIKTPGDMV